MIDGSSLLNLSLATLGRFLIGIVLLIAAIGKWLDHEEFIKAVASYQILPYHFARPVAFAIPWIEITLGLLLITDWLTLVAASLTLGTLAVFTVAQLMAFMRGQQVDCHCFAGLDQEKVGLTTLLRNTILMLITLEVLVFNWGYSARGTWSSQASESEPEEQALLFAVALGILGIYLLAYQARKMLKQAKR